MNTDSDQKVKVLVNGSWIFFPRSFLQILGKCQTCLKTIRRAKWWFWNDTSNSFCQSFNKKFSTIDTYFANYNASLWNLFFLLVVKNSHHGKQIFRGLCLYFWILNFGNSIEQLCPLSSHQFFLLVVPLFQIHTKDPPTSCHNKWFLMRNSKKQCRAKASMEFFFFQLIIGFP